MARKKAPADLQKYIDKIAAKLLNEGLTYSTYTKAKAISKTKKVVAPVFVRKMINSFSPEIKAAMKKMRK